MAGTQRAAGAAGDGGGGDARRASAGGGGIRMVRMSAHEHRCLLDTLRACVAAADAASALLVTAADTAKSPKNRDGAESTEKPIAATVDDAAAQSHDETYMQNVALLQRQRSDLLRMLSQALGALEQVTDVQATAHGEQSPRVVEASKEQPPPTTERRTDPVASAGRKKKREVVHAPTAERRHKSTPERGCVLKARSQSSVGSRRQRHSRIRERDRRGCKRTCGVIKVIVRKRQAESEPRRHKEENAEDEDEITEKNVTSKGSHKCGPRAAKNSRYEMNSARLRTSRLSSGSTSPNLKTKLSQISDRNVRAKRIKSSLDRLFSNRTDKYSTNSKMQYSRHKDGKCKKRTPFTMGMCIDKQYKTKPLGNPKVGVLGICTKVSDPYRDENKRTFESEQGSELIRCPLNSASRRNSAKFSRFSKSEHTSNQHNHQFQVVML